MANWAYTVYAIEGPKNTLARIYNAIMHHEVEEGSDDDWEGNVLKALGLKWLDRSEDREKGKYMRGFLIDTKGIQFNPEEDTVLKFDANEAWGVTDFDEVLMENFPDIKVYWTSEESGMEVYQTNDKEGKYFNDRFYVDLAINNIYDFNYFSDEKSMWQWLSDKVSGLTSREAVEKWNEAHEESGDDDENFINIYEFKIID